MSFDTFPGFGGDTFAFEQQAQPATGAEIESVLESACNFLDDKYAVVTGEGQTAFSTALTPDQLQRLPVAASYYDTAFLDFSYADYGERNTGVAPHLTVTLGKLSIGDGSGFTTAITISGPWGNNEYESSVTMMGGGSTPSVVTHAPRQTPVFTETQLRAAYAEDVVRNPDSSIPDAPAVTRGELRIVQAVVGLFA